MGIYIYIHTHIYIFIYPYIYMYSNYSFGFLYHSILIKVLNRNPGGAETCLSRCGSERKRGKRRFAHQARKDCLVLSREWGNESL